MNPSAPHYFLISHSQSDPSGVWSFILRSEVGSDELEVVDCEPGVQGERLELLSVVRGLEALDQPSKVTLVTPSSYVRQGICYGLSEWRANGWRWESYGEMVPVKNADLWQRVDRALRFHKVDCRRWRIDSAHAPAAPARAAGAVGGAVAAPGAASEPRRAPFGRVAEHGGSRRRWFEHVTTWARRVADRARNSRPTRWWDALVPGHRMG